MKVVSGILDKSGDVKEIILLAVFSFNGWNMAGKTLKMVFSYNKLF